MISKKFLPGFESNDFLYHYCSLNTAKKILYTGKIRLSPRTESTDPVESTKPFIHSGGVFQPDNEEIDVKDLIKTQNIIQRQVENTKQLCFCMNNKDLFKKDSNLQDEEFYGCLKPRMWDQYSDKYKGVCLVFSLSALLEQVNDFLHGCVNYQSYNELSQNIYQIDINKLRKIGPEKYAELYFEEKVKSVLFRKHKDYVGENEYRLISTSDNKYEYLNIDGALKAIIYGDKIISDCSKKKLQIISEQYNVGLYYIKWETTGISINSKAFNDYIKGSIERQTGNDK